MTFYAVMTFDKLLGFKTFIAIFNTYSEAVMFGEKLTQPYKVVLV